MELLTIQEVATMMRVSSITIRRQIKEGELKAVRVGRQIRVPKRAVKQLAKPVKIKVTKQRAAIKEQPVSFDDPLWNIVGTATDAQPTFI